MNSMEIFKQIEKAPFEPGFMPSGEPVIDRRHKKVIDHVLPHGHILEVGPGIGKLAVYFASQGRPYSMVDIDRSKLLTYYEYIGNEIKTPSHVFKEPWEWSMLPDDVYTTVIASEVIEHVSDYKWIVNEMLRVAICNVILTTPVGKSFFSPEHLHFFKEEDFDFIPYDYTIEKIYTKESDIENEQQCFFIEISKRSSHNGSLRLRSR